MLAVTEADFGDGRIVWVQTLATENDPTAGETDVSVESVLTVCRVGDVVHVGASSLLRGTRARAPTANVAMSAGPRARPHR